MELSERQLELKNDFIRERGFWNDTWEGVLWLDPDFFEATLKLVQVPRNHATLEPKVREFIMIAIDASVTHLYAPGPGKGLDNHIRQALEAGATKEEIMEVLEIVSFLGTHTWMVGVPILV